MNVNWSEVVVEFVPADYVIHLLVVQTPRLPVCSCPRPEENRKVYINF